MTDHPSFSRFVTRRRFLGTSAAAAAATILAACGGDTPNPTATGAPAATKGAAGATTLPTTAATTGTTGTTGTTPTGAATAMSASGGTAVSAPAAMAGGVPGPAPTTDPAKVKQGGSLTWASYNEPNTLDPHVSSSRHDYQVEKHIFDTLVVRDDNGGFQPSLATKWESNADGTVWTLSLRKDVKFHDGTPFDAAAAKFSFDRMVNPDTKSEVARSNLGPYDKSEILDDVTIRVTLKTPYGPFIYGLTEDTVAMVSPDAVKKYGKDFGRNPVGSGPFIFKEWIDKDHITYTKNPNYNWAPSIYRHNGPAYLDSVTMRFIKEDQTRLAALETGQVDIILPTPDDQVAKEKKDSRYSVYTTTVQGLPPCLQINVTKAPTDDPKVRQALQFGISQKAILDAIYSGSQIPAKGLLGTNSPYYWAGGETMYGYDTKKAATMLDDAGWKKGADGMRAKSGMPMMLVYLTLPGQIQGIAELVQAQMQEMGIKVDIVVEDNPAQQKDAQKGIHNLVWGNWLLGDPSGLRTVFGSENIGNSWNFPHYSNPKLDDLFTQGERAVDVVKRKEIYTQVQQMILQDAVVFPINYNTRNWTVRNTVKNFRVGPDGEWIHFYEQWLDK